MVGKTCRVHGNAKRHVRSKDRSPIISSTRRMRTLSSTHDDSIFRHFINGRTLIARPAFKVHKGEIENKSFLKKKKERKEHFSFLLSFIDLSTLRILISIEKWIFDKIS